MKLRIYFSITLLYIAYFESKGEYFEHEFKRKYTREKYIKVTQHVLITY